MMTPGKLYCLATVNQLWAHSGKTWAKEPLRHGDVVLAVRPSRYEDADLYSFWETYQFQPKDWYLVLYEERMWLVEAQCFREYKAGCYG